jgi:cell division initiation protein
MKFTPLDIRQKRFATAFRGLARRDVQAFLELLAAEFEEVVKEKIVHAAHQRLVQVIEDINELRRQRTQFESHLRAVIDAHLKLLQAFESPGFSAEEPRIEDNVSFLAPKKAGGTDS